MPPTGRKRVVLATPPPRGQRRRAHHLGREQLEGVGAGVERGESLGRGRHARQHDEARRLGARITAGSPCGMTTSRPPASCELSRHRPGRAPCRRRPRTSGRSAFASWRCWRTGRGELSGTSIRLKAGLDQRGADRLPPRSGTRPRRMATSGRASKPASKASRVGIAGPQEARGAGERRGGRARRSRASRARRRGREAGGLQVEGGERPLPSTTTGSAPSASRGGASSRADQQAGEIGGERRLRQVARRAPACVRRKGRGEGGRTGRAGRRLSRPGGKAAGSCGPSRIRRPRMLWRHSTS